MIISFLSVKPLLARNKTVFEILLKNKAINILVLQLKLMALVMVSVEICARENLLVYCNKASGIEMQNDAVAGGKQYITCSNLEQSRIQNLPSHKNE